MQSAGHNLFENSKKRHNRTLFPKSAAKPEYNDILRNSPDKCSRRRRPYFLQKRIALRHYTQNIIPYSLAKVKCFS